MTDVLAGTAPQADIPGAFASDALSLVLITGMSGAGKSVALRALEDTGYFCVDNLPSELIVQLLQTLMMQRQKSRRHIAIAVDGRSATSLHLLPQILRGLKGAQVDVKLIYLDASDEALIRRFSETRRRHPLSEILDVNMADQHHALLEAITRERSLLADLREMGGAIIDSSLLRPSQLQSWVKATIEAPKSRLTLVFESFAFKRGIPVDADYVFDVRMLANPYYVPELRHLTGKDMQIQQWLELSDDVNRMYGQIRDFLQEWLPAFVDNHRSYLTVAIGCTGGQHRSVYFVEKLSRHFACEWSTVARHRELDH